MLRYCIIACAVLLSSREPSDLVLSMLWLHVLLVHLTQIICRRLMMSNTPLMEKILEFIGHELKTTISANFFWAPYAMNSSDMLKSKNIQAGNGKFSTIH